jgi:glycosyltransferase involved in cell wall biosynthesis
VGKALASEAIEQVEKKTNRIQSSNHPGAQPTSLKIVFSNYDDIGNPYYGGGGAQAIHEVAKRLASRHEVAVITGRYPGSQDTELEGVKYRRIGNATLGPKAGQLYYQVLLPKFVRTSSFDIWIESLTPPFSTACLQLFTRKPVVALTQILAGKAMAQKYKLPFHFIERLGLKTYRYAIALTSSIKSEIAQTNPQAKIAVISNGVPDELIETEFVKSEQYILFLGRIDVQQKGLDLLLQAYRPVSNGLPWPLIIAGAGHPQDEAYLQQRIVEMGLAEKVRLVGKVGGSRKEELFRDAAIFVMPSRFEASPLALLEAFCYRAPVVMFAIPEFQNIPDECCRRVASFDTARFGEALVKLAADPEARRALANNAKKYVRVFGWNGLSGQYEQFLTRIHEETSHRGEPTEKPGTSRT